jgi:hypothetical protein
MVLEARINILIGWMGLAYPAARHEGEMWERPKRKATSKKPRIN